LSISRTEIRENSKYTIREGYLHGVVPNDSVMVALDGESYYFLLPQKSYLYEPNKTNPVIYKGLNLNEYVVLSKESNGYLSALYISFSGDLIQLKQLDLEQKEFDFKLIKHDKIMEGKIPVYILNPSADRLEECDALLQYLRHLSQTENLIHIVILFNRLIQTIALSMLVNNFAGICLRFAFNKSLATIR
jgi:hypothetical protein